MTARKKLALPTAIEDAMKAWRAGFTAIPTSYIEWHNAAAHIDLATFTNAGYRVHNTYMESDGWMDGMKVLHAIVELDGVLTKVVWNDGSQRWFRCFPAGGSGYWDITA